MQEHSSLQKILATHESENTTANFAAAGTQRLLEMEMLEGYKTHVQSLETELHEKTQRLTDNVPVLASYSLCAAYVRRFEKWKLLNRWYVLYV